MERQGRCFVDALGQLYFVFQVRVAKEAGVVAYKLYPAGATTNSASGVTSFDKVVPALKAMAEVRLRMILLWTAI